MTLLADLSTPIVMGILLGGLYAVIALGLSLVFGVVKEINIAHGDLVILGSYFGLCCHDHYRDRPYSELNHRYAPVVWHRFRYSKISPEPSL